MTQEEKIKYHLEKIKHLEQQSANVAAGIEAHKQELRAIQSNKLLIT